MPEAATVNLETWSDADYACAFRWRTGTDPDTFFDFTGNEMMLMARHHPEDVDAFLSLTTGYLDGIVFSKAAPEDEELTVVNIYISRAQLELVPVGVHAQSLIMIRPDGLHADLWRGTLTHAIGPTR